VSKALLYHYYPGKDALIFAIIETHLSALDAAIAAADEPALPPEQRLETLVRTVLDRYRGADDAHKVQLNAGPALSEAQKAALRAIERRIVGRFANVIRTIRPDLPPHLVMPATMSLFGMMNWVYMWFREGGAISRDDYARLATRIMLGGLPAAAED
jgi:AcrR family transcriptional regulator